MYGKLLILLVSIVHLCTSQEAKQIVFTTEDNNHLKYDENALNAIFSELDDSSFKIISFIGQARKGKSSTLNAIISKLVDKQIHPFGVSYSMDPCTKGIYIYVVPKCIHKSCDGDSCRKDEDCIQSDFSFIFLDMEGSDTLSNELVRSYSAIITLLSSKIFLFIHEKLYLRDTDYIEKIEEFRQIMNRQQVDLAIKELDLGIVIREPLGELTITELRDKINTEFNKYSELEKHEFLKGMANREVYVQSIANMFEEKKKYKEDIMQIKAHLINAENYVASRGSKVNFETLEPKKIITFIRDFVHEINKDTTLNGICLACVYRKIVEWNKWSEWSVCNEDCGGGRRTKERTCNTGRKRDCEKYAADGSSSVMVDNCNEYSCDDLEWGDWTSWTECSEKCEGGTQQRFRQCKTGNAGDCIQYFKNGTEKEERKCNGHSCNIICATFGIFCW